MRLFSQLGMLLGGPVSVVERFKPELTCELSTGREGGGGGGCHKEVAISEGSTVSMYSHKFWQIFTFYL